MALIRNFFRIIKRAAEIIRDGRRLKREPVERARWARQQLRSLSDASKRRFSELVLIELLNAGWTEGRRMAADSLASLQNGLPQPVSRHVAEILAEFGGLQIGLMSPDTKVGAVYPAWTSHLSALAGLVGIQLCPIGHTAVFGNDGLVLYADELGRVFADGSAGDHEPGKWRLDYLAASFDRALEIMYGEPKRGWTPEQWPGLPTSGVWHYNDREG